MAASHDELGKRKAFRPHEVARLLGVSRAFGYQLVKQGRIRSVRCGHAILVPADAVDEFLRQRDEDDDCQ